MSSKKALLPCDLKRTCAVVSWRLTSYVVLREEIKTYSECRGHAHARNMRPKGSSHLDPVDIRAFGKGKGDQDKGKHGKDTGRRRHGQHDKNKDSIENVGTVESAVLTGRIVGARRSRRTKVVRKESTKPRIQRTLTILIRRNQQTLNQKLKLVDST